ncbi:hypothetical protein EVAR_80888_1 [Eumeta japonica]|uniref:Uncharacterized protein n=1 Tax=Eumeta variegata TaxID=151549 RepID=A0A4C1V1H1_EUMVA|nr:hypothetical protein EVAR_80888_1 [Eumeta japonica]
MCAIRHCEQVKPVDEERSNAQKTRPRLYITPGVGVDDVPEGARRELVRDVYATTYGRAAGRAAAARGAADRAPLAMHPASATPNYGTSVEIASNTIERRTAHVIASALEECCGAFLERRSDIKAQPPSVVSFGHVMKQNNGGDT